MVNDWMQILRFDSPAERDAAIRVLSSAVAYETEPYEDLRTKLFEAVREYLGIQQQAEDEFESQEANQA